MTVVSYTKFTIGDAPTKRYIVYGKKTPNIFVLREFLNHIEYPEDVTLSVEWKNSSTCVIVSDQPPIEESTLAEGLTIEIVVDNEKFGNSGDVLSIKPKAPPGLPRGA